MAIALDDLLDPRHVRLSLKSRTLEKAIHELIALLAVNEQVTDAQKFAEQVITRERTNPSVVELGVTFPHARTDLVEKIVLAIGRKTAGIPFGENGESANLIFLIGVPQRLVNDYLVVVGSLARIARNESIRRQLLRAATPEEFIQIVRAAGSPDAVA